MDIATTMVFLVMMMVNTEQPVLVVMQAHPTARACNEIIARAPPEAKDKFMCVRMELRPQSEPETKTL